MSTLTCSRRCRWFLCALGLLVLGALGSGAADRAVAAPAGGASGLVRFAVVGDYGIAGPEEASVAALIQSWHPDFVITTGDNNYPDGGADTIDANIGQYYHSYIAPYLGGYGVGAPSNAFWPCMGNHEWETPNAQPYLDYFTLPNNERYYDVARGTVHLFAVDSDLSEPDGNTSTSVQGAWLQSRLAAAAEPWKLVY